MIDLSDGVKAKQVRLQQIEARGSSKDVVVMEQELIALRCRVTKMSSELQACKESYAKLESQAEDRRTRMQKELDGAYANLKELRFRWAESKRLSKRELQSLQKEKKEKLSRLAAAETNASRQEALYYAVKRELTRVSTDTASKASKLEKLFAQRLKAVEERAAAAEAAATACNDMFSLVVGSSCCETDTSSITRSLNDQLNDLRRDLQIMTTANESLTSERDRLRKQIADRVRERDAAVEKAQSTYQSLEKSQTELRSRRASLAKLSEDSTHDMQNIARLRGDLDCARRTAANASRQLAIVEEAHAKMEKEYARVRDESDAKTVAIATLQQAKRDAENQCNAARSRAARLDVKLAKGQQDIKETAGNLAATTLEAIVREKHDMKRSLANADITKRRANEVIRLLTDRCVYVAEELRRAAMAEAAWREERILLLASLQNTREELAERRRSQGDENLDESDATEHAEEDALVRQAREHMRSIMSAMPSATPGAPQVRVKCNPEFSTPNSSWDIFEVDGDEDLVERFDLHRLTRRISGLIEQDMTTHGFVNESGVAGAIVEKIAELATMVGRVEADSAHRLGEAQESLVAISTRLAKLEKMYAPTEEASLVDLAKKDAVVRLVRHAAFHAVDADLAGLRIDDETCASVVRALANPDHPRAGDAWEVSSEQRPAKVTCYDNQTVALCSSPLEYLLRLTLSGNLIGDIGASCIARTIVSTTSCLVALDLSRNSISMKGCAALKDAAKSNGSIVHVEFVADFGKQSRDDGPRIIGWRKRGDWDKVEALRSAEEAGVDDEKAPMIIDVRSQCKTSLSYPAGVSIAALRAAMSHAPPVRLQPQSQRQARFCEGYKTDRDESEESSASVVGMQQRSVAKKRSVRPSSAPLLAKPRRNLSRFPSSSSLEGVYEFAYGGNSKTVLRRLISSSSSNNISKSRSSTLDGRSQRSPGRDALFLRRRVSVPGT